MKKFAVLGHPISHSFSPVMHKASFDSIGFNASYCKFDVPPENLEHFLHQLAEEGYTGVNLTIPHKQHAISLMTELSDNAEKLGAVNTVLFRKDGSMFGDNTDAPGFIRAAKNELDFEPENSVAAVFGCGGAGRAIALALAANSVKKLLLIDEFSPQSLPPLISTVNNFFPSVNVVSASREMLPEAALIVQCTPAGLAVQPNAAISAEDFSVGQKLFDIVISPHCLQTPTMSEAAKKSVRACNGISMLVEQGAISFEIWTGLHPDRVAMRNAVDAALAEQAKGQ